MRILNCVTARNPDNRAACGASVKVQRARRYEPRTKKDDERHIAVTASGYDNDAGIPRISVAECLQYIYPRRRLDDFCVTGTAMW